MKVILWLPHVLKLPDEQFAFESSPEWKAWPEDETDACFWLLDSGASRSVLAERFAHRYRVLYERKLENPLVFSTASGEQMSVEDEVMIQAHFWIWESNIGKYLKRDFELRCLKSNTQHNLLSMGQMCRQGWHFKMTEEGPSASWGTCHFLIDMFGGCPWLTASLGSRRQRVAEKTPFDDAMEVFFFVWKGFAGVIRGTAV